MIKKNTNQDAFLALVSSGLWEQEVRLSQFRQIDFSEVYRLAVDQSVVGLITAGLEHISDYTVPKENAWRFIGSVLIMELRNKEMNRFIGEQIEILNSQGINALLIKGQGVAQNYERPLWRSAGDVDLLLDDINYQKAKDFFGGSVPSERGEGAYTKHVSLTIDSWELELHGTMRTDVTSRMDSVIDSVQKEAFENGKARIWNDDGVDVLLPCPDDDIIFVFTHILHHFYRGGLGMRQICDWCRLLHNFNGQIDKSLLLSRLKKAAILQEWRLFGSFAVNYLGMPAGDMPFYEAPSSNDWRKIRRIKDYILEKGNSGHNRDRSGYGKHPFLIRKLISLWRKCGDILYLSPVFPVTSFRYFSRYLSNGIKSAARRMCRKHQSSHPGS